MKSQRKKSQLRNSHRKHKITSLLSSEQMSPSNKLNIVILDAALGSLVYLLATLQAGGLKLDDL